MSIMASLQLSISPNIPQYWKLRTWTSEMKWNWIVYTVLWDSERTFVVHVGGHLDHAEAEVDRKVAEVIVGLQDEVPSQLYAVAQIIHLVDQHGVEVFILETERESQFNTAQQQDILFCFLFFPISLAQCVQQAELWYR